MRPHDVLDDRQSEAGTMAAALGREEGLEHVLELLGREPFAAVQDVHSEARGLCLAAEISGAPLGRQPDLIPRGDPHRAPGRGGVECVQEQIEEELLQMVGIRQHGGQADG